MGPISAYRLLRSGDLRREDRSPRWPRIGADMVKVFPCGAMGGAAYVRSLKAPLPQIDLVPTGGVSLATVGDFIGAGASAVGAGADLVNVSKARDGNGGAVSDAARKYLGAIRAAREAMHDHPPS